MRLSFFSGGSDIRAFYSKEPGAALSATIDKYIYVILHKTPYSGIRIIYDDVEEFKTVDEMEHLITKESLMHFNIKKDCTIASISDINIKGSGLGSSSAFTVGLVNVLASSKWETSSREYLADTACTIEIDRCGYPIGKQDQYAAAYGGFNLFKFDTDGEVTSTKPSISKETKSALEESLILVNSGVGRSANKILQQQQEAMSDSTKFDLVRKSRDKAFLGAKYLELGDWESFGGLLHEAWLDKKSVVKEITQSYFDDVYLKAMTAGALGGKLIGAGGGGFFLFSCRPEKRENVIAAVTKDTQCKVYPFKFSDSGSRIVTAMCV